MITMMKNYKPPAGICEEAKQYFKNLLQELDYNCIIIKSPFDIIAWTYHHWMEATSIIEKEGLVIKENGITKIHPAIQIQHDFKNLLNGWIEEFENILEEPGYLQKFKR